MIKKPTHKFHEEGFGLVETMVTIVITTILIGGTLAFMAKIESSRVSQEMFAQTQENGRISLEWISYDLRMAGNRGRTYTLSPLVKTAVAGLQPTITENCFTNASQALDWALALLPTGMGERTPAILGEDNLTASGPSVFSGCGIAADDVQVGSDIISMHYLEAEPVSVANLEEHHIYISSGIGQAVLFQCPTFSEENTCASLLTDKQEDNSGAAYYRLVSHAYYVRNWSYESGDGLPMLVRIELQNNGNVVTVPLMEGIRNLQVRFGIDNNDDGFVDQFKTPAQMPVLSLVSSLTTSWSKIKSVKVDVLAQSVYVDPRRGDGSKTYTVAGQEVTLPEKYLAKVFSTTVTTRNARSQG